MKPSLAMGVMAYNEERNIGALLDSVLAQNAIDQIARIVVVASGCTDRTCEIASAYAKKDPRIELLEEPDRSGKTAAVNKFLLSTTEEIVVVSSADLILEPNTLEELIRPFEDPEIGMTGSHPVPLNANDSFFGYAANLMWTLHHDVSMRDPKMGELIAFRNVFRRVDPSAISDELSVHQLVRSAGYRVTYAPLAIVHNKGPENLRDFVSKRMRCIVGNLQIKHDHNVPVSTLRTLPVLRAALPHAMRNWKHLHWTVSAAALELYCRMRSQFVYRSKKRRQRFHVWEQVTTTKSLVTKPPAAKIAR